MKRRIQPHTLIIRGNNRSDCAHGCRYCPIKRKRSVVERDRFAAFVERVREWVKRDGGRWSMWSSLGYHANHDRDDLEMMRRLDGPQPLRGITLGGLPDRTDDELRVWLDLLKEYGLQTVHATFGGTREMHDHWNNKKNNFDLLMRTLHVAGRMDFKLGQRLLVGKSTLSHLEPLLDLLEELPQHVGDWRYAMPFFYQTSAQKPQPHVELDRIDESLRDSLPQRILSLFMDPDEKSNLSEREWMRYTAPQDDPVDKVTAVIRVTADAMDELEATPIEDVVGDLWRRTESAYAAMPTFSELRDRYGDRFGTSIYSVRRCVEMKWLDMYRAENPDVRIDQSLTHCWFGG